MIEQDISKSYGEGQHIENIKELEDEENEGMSHESDEREFDDCLQMIKQM